MRVLVYGANGWIGGMLVNEWKTRYPTDTVISSTTRVKEGNEILLLSEIMHADRVVCMIGRTSGRTENGEYINTIDYLEQPGKLRENIGDNLYAPLLLAILCSQLGKHLLYLGTGCIFNWDTRIDTKHKIKEEDYPTFFGSSYSTVKGFTDNLVKLFPNVCNCRIRMPIVNYSHQRNFITKIVGYTKINNMPNSMTYLPEMIPIMIEMSREGAKGTYNMTNPGYISHSEILEEYREKVEPSHVYELVTDEKELNLASKRSNNILNTKKLEDWCKVHDLKLSSIQDAIKECFFDYKTNF